MLSLLEPQPVMDNFPLLVEGKEEMGGDKQGGVSKSVPDQ